jgi:hypothetical protein
MWNGFRQLAAAVFPAQFPGVKPAGEDEFASEKLLLHPEWAFAFVCPRGIGPQSLSKLVERKQTQLRRRLLLLGESLESGQVWDVVQAAAALRNLPGMAKLPLWLTGGNVTAANALYASLFIPDVEQLNLDALPASHRDGPIYLNSLRHLDLPQAVALAAEGSTLVLHAKDLGPWRYAQDTAKALKWGDDCVQLREAAERQQPPSR